MPPTVCAWTDHGSRCGEALRVGELLRGTLELALEKQSIADSELEIELSPRDGDAPDRESGSCRFRRRS
jgi:hypothetical protein